MVIKVQKRKKKKWKKNLKKGDSFGAFATSSLLSDTYVRIFFTHHYHHPLHLHLHLHIFTFTTTLLFLSLFLSLCWTNTSLQQRSPNFGSPLLNLSLTLFQTKSLFYFNIVQIIHIYNIQYRLLKRAAFVLVSLITKHCVETIQSMKLMA